MPAFVALTPVLVSAHNQATRGWLEQAGHGSEAIPSAPLLDRHRNPAGVQHTERMRRWDGPPPEISPGTNPPPGRPACRYRLSGPDTAPHFARVLPEAKSIPGNRRYCGRITPRELLPQMHS